MDKVKIFIIGCGILLFLCLFLFFSQMCDTDSKNLGNGFVYNAEHKHILGNIDIPPAVVSFDYDKNYIIVKQEPVLFHNAIYDKKEYIYPQGRDAIYYWLILKEDQKVFGPLDSIQFLKLRKDYGVPEKLKFMNMVSTVISTGKPSEFSFFEVNAKMSDIQRGTYNLTNYSKKVTDALRLQTK